MNQKITKECNHRTSLKCSSCSLGKLCFPEGLDLEALTHLDQLQIKHREIAKGEFLYRQNDLFKLIFTVKGGSFKSFTNNAVGAEQVDGFYVPGELVGLEGISNETYSSSLVALEQSYVCEVEFNQLFSLSAKIPSLQRRILTLVSQHLSPQFSISINSSAKARVASFLLHLSSRFKQRGLSATNFTLTMSREDIGNYLGLAAETVSRILNALDEQATLNLQRRKVELINFRQLQIDACEKVG